VQPAATRYGIGSTPCAGWDASSPSIGNVLRRERPTRFAHSGGNAWRRRSKGSGRDFAPKGRNMIAQGRAQRRPGLRSPETPSPERAQQIGRRPVPPFQGLIPTIARNPGRRCAALPLRSALGYFVAALRAKIMLPSVSMPWSHGCACGGWDASSPSIATVFRRERSTRFACSGGNAWRRRSGSFAADFNSLVGRAAMLICDRFRYKTIQVLLTLALACAFIAANNSPNYDDPNGDRCYGFPFVYRFDNILNSMEALGDGATAQHPRAEIIWSISYDELGAIANIGVFVWLILVTIVVSFVARQRTFKAALLPK
jgi:hypothetical protein